MLYALVAIRYTRRRAFGDLFLRGLQVYQAICKVALLVDGGYLRVLVKKADIPYDPDYIEKVAHACIGDDEDLLRVLYCDCPPFVGTVKLPISGQFHEYRPKGRWLDDLTAKPLFTVRLGTLKFRGFRPKKNPIAWKQLSDGDFVPSFEQKGVDMRLGLDIAHYANRGPHHADYG